MRFFILLCLIIASGFFSPSNYTATAAARVPYPENTQNSCLRAVKTWVSDHHHSNVETSVSQNQSIAPDLHLNPGS